MNGPTLPIWQCFGKVCRMGSNPGIVKNIEQQYKLKDEN